MDRRIRPRPKPDSGKTGVQPTIPALPNPPRPVRIQLTEEETLRMFGTWPFRGWEPRPLRPEDV